jgi:hypothetical protein
MKFDGKTAKSAGEIVINSGDKFFFISKRAVLALTTLGIYTTTRKSPFDPKLKTNQYPVATFDFLFAILEPPIWALS